ncbi:hypothetical protein EI541_21640, partial [Xanthomonas citri pv. eucalyptorum]
VNRGIPTESARNGEIPKIQTPLFGTMRHAALSDLFVQTFLRSLRSCRSAAMASWAIATSQASSSPYSSIVLRLMAR